MWGQLGEQAQGHFSTRQQGQTEMSLACTVRPWIQCVCLTQLVYRKEKHRDFELVAVYVGEQGPRFLT